MDFEESKHYEGFDRRKIPTVSEAQISLMIEEEVERRISKLEDKLMTHMDSKFAQLHRLIVDAFPDGDPHGHRAYHQLQIKQAEGWDKIKGDVLSKFLTGGMWLAAGYLALALWNAFKDSVKG